MADNRTVELSGEAHDRLLSHQRDDETLAETIERLSLVLPMYPDVDLDADAEFVLARIKVEGGGYRTDEYDHPYDVYKEFAEAMPHAVGVHQSHQRGIRARIKRLFARVVK